MSLGPLIIVSGPAGSGKTTLIRRALQEFGPRLRHSVSATTRPPRGAEVDGEDYHFWTRDRFEQGIAAGEFLEYATVFGRDYYGTLRSEVDRYREQGVGVIVDVDVQGAEQLRVTCPGAFSVFVETPPGQYERRLRARGTESDESIQWRLETARLEVARAGEFDRRILNDDVDRAAAELSAEIRRLFEANEGRSTCSRS